ncbi:Methyltransferase type 11 domain protein [mine drainage metagenome]|uniref:Methyltransferase type 11 domain protein n=1 Tax=mine drainage metagenome TaxID=410659 RepID=T0Z121_9ZZZZ
MKKGEKMTGQTKDRTKNTVKEEKDPYMPYYNGKEIGQDKPSKSMQKLSVFLKKNNTTRILDFSCGTGRNLIFMAKRGFDVSGFDSSKYAVRTCRAELRREGLDAQVRLCNMERGLPYRNESFDAVMAIRAMYQTKMENIRRLASEVDRVLKKGGYVYMESKQCHLCFFGNGRRVVKVEPGTYKWLGGGTYYHFFKESELRNLFKGYRTVRFYFKKRTYYVLFQKPF